MTTQIVSQYAYHKPKALHWSPRPLALAKRHPLRPIAERTSLAKLSQPVVKVQDEHHEESELVEPDAHRTARGQVQGLNESSSLSDSSSPTTRSGDLQIHHVGVSPEDFLRNALPSTHNFVLVASSIDHRLSPPHRLRASSSMSNISSGSTKSRPPSVMSITGQLHRTSSRLSSAASS